MRTFWLLICLTLLGACTAEPVPDRPASGPPASAASAAAQQAATAPAAPSPTAVAAFRQGRVSAFSDAGGETRGLAAQPDAPGLYPLILVIHGEHTPCPADLPPRRARLCPAGSNTPYVEGLAYLLDALAAQGYIAVAPDIGPALSAASTDVLGGETYGSPGELYRIILNTIDLLEQANGGERAVWEDLVGQVDFDRIGLIGHSAGATLASASLSGPGLGGHDLAGQLLVTPLPLELASSRGGPPTPPFAIIEAACDMLAPHAGRQLIAGDATPGLRGLVLLQGASHTQFNQLAAAESARLENVPPECRPDERLAPEEQQAFLAQYAVAFFDQLFEQGEQTPIGLDFAQPPPETLFGHALQTWLQLPDARRQTLLGGGAGGERGPGMAAQGLDASRCGISYSCPVFTAGQPGGLRLGWARPELRYELPLYGANTDLQAFDRLHLRLLVDPDDVRNRPFESQQLSILLRDLAGNEATVALPPDALALRRPALAEPLDPATSLRLLPLSASLPLAEFAGVDLGQVVSLELIFPARSGLIYLVEIEAIVVN